MIENMKFYIFTKKQLFEVLYDQFAMLAKKNLYFFYLFSDGGFDGPGSDISDKI